MNYDKLVQSCAFNLPEQDLPPQIPISQVLTQPCTLVHKKTLGMRRR